ncbi:GntR family transcriptional regulator [Blastopirellula sp. JC732]|uniref:GntR family transcriptional regulator n=1 Tax=Blastopirellula sediminis TaxID=2894196 RepID=A0A9X1MT33_9BACT|nr:GntR family transcriptional regulator [Blastopirellula sediminis]MCC9604706.1 GntR family transcriptional regulator [Blastopirellula sediminis]MCC9631995.1 GntR family transcriptional regulator [Blastopirellula sediminis]
MVKRQCMSDEIRDTLATRIYDGSLQPGERLIELAIAQEFGTSQTPVREALRELEAMRLVQSEPYKGTRVREITPREMAEAYLVRAILEQRAAELAAPRFQNSIDRLQQKVDEICESAARGDIDAYARSNMEFHRAIVAAADNQVLLQSWDALQFDARIRVNLFRKNKAIVDRAAEHQPIIDALARGDGDEAGRLLREHSESFAAVWAQEAQNPTSDSDAPTSSCSVEMSTTTD